MRVVFVLLLSLCHIGPARSQTCANGQASSFYWPIANWSGETGNGYWDTAVQPYHLAIDTIPSAGAVGEPVYAPCTGVVKESRHSNGYGGLVIMECNTGSECVTPLLAHMFTTDTVVNGQQYQGLQVTAGDAVTQGEVIGYLADQAHNGGWVPHLHFGIRKGSYASAQACDGLWAFAGYSADICTQALWYAPVSFIANHQSEAPYMLHDGPVVCHDPVEGGAHTDWWYSCDEPDTSFLAGETVHSLIRIAQVRETHRFKVTAYRDEVFQWDWIADWNHISSGQMWQYSHFWPTLANAQVGEWAFHFDIDVGSGFPGSTGELGQVSFTVQPDPRLFIYHDTAVACAGPVSGGAHTNWQYQCQNIDTVFSAGEDVTAFIQLEQVRLTHRYKVAAYHNGAFAWEWIPDWNQLGPNDIWQYSHFWPTLHQAPAGEWQMRLYIDVGNGFIPLDIVSFTVLP